MSSELNRKRIIIRKMTPEDVLQVERLDRESFTIPWPNNAFAYELCPDANNICLVAADTAMPPDHSIIGVAIFWLIVDELHLGTISVLKAYRHRSIGLALLVEGLLEGSHNGMKSSLLEVRAGNHDAQHLYLGLGYEIVGLRPRYYSDNHEDALLMTLPQIDNDKLVKIKVALSSTFIFEGNRVESRSGVSDES